MVSESKNKKSYTINFSERNILSLPYSMHKISVAIFWFYQDGYDISTRKGKKVKQICTTRFDYCRKTIVNRLNSNITN